MPQPLTPHCHRPDWLFSDIGIGWHFEDSAVDGVKFEVIRPPIDNAQGPTSPSVTKCLQ